MTMFLLFSILIYFLDYFTLTINSASYIYLFTENLSLDLVIQDVSIVQKVFYSILLSSLLFKLGAFPFHFYLADMYQSLNERETMFVYTISLKLAIFVTLLKLLTSFWYLNYSVIDLIICSGFGSMLVSSFSILKQYKLSKFWAYSYLNSIGFTLLAVASGIFSEFGEISFFAAKVYFLTYIITWFGILDFISTYSLKSVDNRIDRKLYYVSDLLYVSSNENSNICVAPLCLSDRIFFWSGKINGASWHLIAIIISLFGLPPALGFFSKALVYFSLATNPQTLLVFVFVLLLSPLTSFAYLKLIIYLVQGELSVKNSSQSKIYISANSYSRYIVDFRSVSYLLVICFPMGLFWVFKHIL